MEIINDEEKVINTFYSSTPKQEPNAKRDMATENISYTVNRSLKADAGLHRFQWTMDHAGPWDSRSTRRLIKSPENSCRNKTTRTLNMVLSFHSWIHLCGTQRVTKDFCVYSHEPRTHIGVQLNVSVV